MKDIAERLEEYLSDKEMDGKVYDRIVLLVPDIEDALVEIEQLRARIQDSSVLKTQKKPPNP